MNKTSKYVQRSPRGPVPAPLSRMRQTDHARQYLLTGYFIRFAESYSFFRADAVGIVGKAALRAIELARAERDADDYGLAVVWWSDDDADIDWTTDSASALNRCEREHDGRHVITLREWRRRTDKHADGSLESECQYAAVVEMYGAVVVRKCAECGERAVWNEPCKDCETLDSLWGIDSGPDSDYGRVVAAELIAEAIAGIKEREQREMQVSRERGKQYVGRGL